ncbi:MAG: universal stress protein [Synergistaceae bacterium]|nr:universal stress protein [Synergistaceae bacterium]
MRRVVVAIDGSEASKGVVDYAIHYASVEKDAEMLFLHVISILEQKPIFYGEGAAYMPPSDAEVKKEFENFIHKRIELSGLTIPRMSVSIRTGRDYDQIVNFADKEDADIIMIGHRGLSGVERFFLGSVAAKVVSRAPCSVYVHRPKELKGEHTGV